ncbi:MerR family transcriptional regulator [Pseudoduganella sp.]|uniref:MerR family transcriptional regulator n=1 Tax=Pseudoduganella sp. TaxID=1880898 RepID=UPI0035AE2359
MNNAATLSIGQLARRCGISRSTLLYYEAQGLLAPRRSAAGYRRYSEADVARAEQVRAWRATGMGIDAIAALLQDGGRHGPIEQRLAQIAADMARLREQQEVLLRVLAGAAGGRRPDPRAAAPGPGAGGLDKAGWSALLRAAGLDDDAMARWHALFEQQAPQAHASFLRSLGLPAAEIERIRSWSRRMGV